MPVVGRLHHWVVVVRFLPSPPPPPPLLESTWGCVHPASKALPPSSSVPRAGYVRTDPPGRAGHTSQTCSSPSLLPASGVSQPQGHVPPPTQRLPMGECFIAPGLPVYHPCQRFQGSFTAPLPSPACTPGCVFPPGSGSDCWARSCSRCPAEIQPSRAAGGLSAPLGPGEAKPEGRWVRVLGC